MALLEAQDSTYRILLVDQHYSRPAAVAEVAVKVRAALADRQSAVQAAPVLVVLQPPQIQRAAAAAQAQTLRAAQAAQESST
jgi:hypothetical protein